MPISCLEFRGIPAFNLQAENGVVVTVSVFADEAAAAESSRRAAAWVEQDAADLIHLARQVTTGEVTVHQTA